MEEYYRVIHSSPQIRTLGEYLRYSGSPAFYYGQVDENGFAREVDFLNISYELKTNRERIIEKHFTREEIASQKDIHSKLIIVPGTELVIPKSTVTREGLLTQGIQVVSNSTPTFKAKALVELEANKEYYQSRHPYNSTKGVVKQMYPNVSVWIWCRALSSKNDTGELSGQLFNVSPFIESVNTSVGSNGGNFQLSLAPITCELIEGKWEVKKTSLSTYINKSDGSINYYSTDGILQQVEGSGGNVVERTHFLFHNILSSNDLVFIRFEKLALEKDREVDSNIFNIDRKDIANKTYDMIGLIDNNKLGVDFTSNDVSINIDGRDLSKLFIEDGTYFYSLENSQGKLNFAGSSTLRSSLLQRVFTDNSLMYLSLYYNTSIEEILKFIIQQLSTIKVVPDDLFTSYIKEENGRTIDRRNTVFNEDKNSSIRFEKLYNSRREFDEGARLSIRASREQYQLTLSDTDKEEKEIEKIFFELYTFLKTIREEKIRRVLVLKNSEITEGWSKFKYTNSSSSKETVEQDKFPLYFTNKLFGEEASTITRDTYTGTAIFNIDRILDIEKSISEYKPEISTTPALARGIWQIVKLVIDSSVINRKIVDSSMSSASGSLLNFIRKCCQEPFVEFRMDTYGDMYYLVVRKQPYNKEGILSLLDNVVISEDKSFIGPSRESDVLPSSTININAEDVLKENLEFNEDEIYSWYHFTPQGNFIGGGENFSLAYLPAIYFEEYAEIWGSKPYELVHNYLPYLAVDDSNKQLDLDFVEKQAFEDLKFMVDISCYLPFTRKGTLTVNGDRRIKVGNIIRYTPTGEIFFVDSVQNKYQISGNSIDRVTTITVSRGMVERFIKGVKVSELDPSQAKNDTLISYFNIINTELNYTKKPLNSKDTTFDRSQVFSNFKVNGEVFNFFLRREYLKYR